MRVKESLGINHYNEGSVLCLSESKYVVDHSRKFYLFDVIPMGSPRMTRRDAIFTNPNHIDPKKRQRPVITTYWAYKNLLVLQANKMGYVLGEYLDAVFFIPMPNAWPEKKKLSMLGKPCKVKPDIDNCVKAVLDCLRTNDSDIWYVKALKIYAYNGSILIYQ